MPTSNSYVFDYFKLPELIDEYLTKCTKLPNFRYVIAQLEETISKKLHIQGYIEFSTKTPMKVLKQIMPGLFIEHRKGTREQARVYCMKSASQVSGPIEYGTWETSQGERTDIKQIKKDVIDGRSMEQLLYGDREYNYQQIRVAEKLIQYRNNPRDPHKPPEVRWYWGSTGTGKTRSVYEEFAPEDIYESSSHKWFNGYHYQKVILIDDMRRDWSKYHILLKFLDRFPHRVEIKGGYTQINSPIIIITCCYHPKDLYDTREDIKQLLRRITSIIHYKTPEKGEGGVILATPLFEREDGEHSESEASVTSGSNLGGSDTPPSSWDFYGNSLQI